MAPIHGKYFPRGQEQTNEGEEGRRVEGSFEGKSAVGETQQRWNVSCVKKSTKKGGRGAGFAEARRLFKTKVITFWANANGRPTDKPQTAE